MNPATFTLSAARDALARRAISSLELADFFLERIAHHNPQSHAFITITAESAREQAQRADAEMARGISRSAQHGIPLALKDIFDQRGVVTTAGSKILRENLAAQDAEAVARLRNAGAVFLGKTNMNEFAFGVTNQNPHYGDVPNPWDQTRVPGGSSGGSAVAVSARLCLGALGTDTGGSIRIPSALCGVTGIKPTYGRVSLRGVVPLSWSNDHAGPIAQTAQDCALLLNTLAGYDAQDPASVNVSAPDFTRALNDSLRGLRFVAPKGYFEEKVDAQVLDAVKQAVGVLEELGAARVAKTFVAAPDMFQLNRVILRSEALAYHRNYLATQPEAYSPDVLRRLHEGESITTAEYALARRTQVELVRAFEVWFEDIDLLVIPTTRTAAPRVGTDPLEMAQHLTAFTAPFNVTGFPAISLPCGFTREGLPIGLQIVGARWREDLILRAAHQYQLATDWHERMPGM
ncbi:MAG: Asp-tRNA(Asn)/Glu-tRNA(Gln) amidotransferase subunit GatA [Chloroflexi bacterium]|nr:Asp-tRNA(Asn)/Glu-tRNA(Gln) amidotransferase subunit GatA [Chloroflexota bacterium]